MQAVKLKARIENGTLLEWLEPLPNLPSGEVEIIVLYHYQDGMKEPMLFDDTQEETGDRDDESIVHSPYNLTAEEIADRLRWIDEHAGCIPLPDEEAMEGTENIHDDPIVHSPYNLTAEEIADRLRWIDEHAGCIPLSDEEAMELAMDSWIAEENLDL